MRVDVYTERERLMEDKITGKSAVVVDVISAGTSIIWAVKNGSYKIIPAVEYEEAVSMYRNFGESECLLCGELNNEKPEGFVLGVSPEEYKSELVSEKTIIMCSDNGTKAIRSARSAKHILIGALINRVAVAKKLLEYGDDVVLICAGSDNDVSSDDICGAGAIINSICSAAAKADKKVTLSDTAFICRAFYAGFRNKNIDMNHAPCCMSMINNGKQNIVDFCLAMDTTTTVPEYVDGIIR